MFVRARVRVCICVCGGGDHRWQRRWSQGRVSNRRILPGMFFESIEGSLSFAVICFLFVDAFRQRIPTIVDITNVS